MAVDLVRVETLMVVALFIQFCFGQDRIVFRDEGETDFSYNSISSSKVPEKLLIRLKDVQNVTEFMRFVLVEERNENQRATINGRRAFSPAPTIARPASCQPEEHVVELERPGHGPILLWPSCVRVKRCGGCCPSKMLNCTPTETSLFNVTVLQVRYDPLTPDSFTSEGTKTFSLVQHDRCACNCKTSSDNCGPAQEYREDECRCVCTNQDQIELCRGPQRIWDSFDCTCKCRRIRDCSTGSYFNPFRCRCESLQSFAPNNFENSSTSSSASRH